ncbi:MAG: hypothetical protein KC561_15785, partial [Myxococcales bacterium]|nr:hypothetical protein [Myxococcales bacterium]
MTRDLQQTASVTYVQVIIDVPVHTYFTYSVPPPMVSRLRPGSRVFVPFRGRPRTGIAYEVSDNPGETPLESIKAILSVLEPEPVLPEPMLHLLDWISRYYFAPPGEVLRLMLPKPLRAKGRQLFELQHPGPDGSIDDRAKLQAVEILRERAAAAPDQPELDGDDLRRQVSGLTFVKLAELEEEGWISAKQESPSTDRGKKIVAYLEHAGGGDDGRLGQKQAEVLQFLVGRGPTLKSEVRDLTGAGYSTLRSLVERGLINETQREQYRDPFFGEPAPLYVPIVLTPEQERAVRVIARNPT